MVSSRSSRFFLVTLCILDPKLKQNQGKMHIIKMEDSGVYQIAPGTYFIDAMNHNTLHSGNQRVIQKSSSSLNTCCPSPGSRIDDMTEAFWYQRCLSVCRRDHIFSLPAGSLPLFSLPSFTQSHYNLFPCSINGTPKKHARSSPNVPPPRNLNTRSFCAIYGSRKDGQCQV